MKSPIRLYETASPSRALRRWTLPEFVGYAQTAHAGPTPNAMPGGGNYFSWSGVDYAQNAIVDLAGLAGAYIDAMSAAQSQCAILIQSNTQAALRFDALNDITAAGLNALVESIGGPSPTLFGAIVTPSTNSGDLADIVELLAVALMPAGQPPAYGSVAGIWNFTDAFGAAPAGYFGRYVPVT